MANRPVYNASDLASAEAGVAGRALAVQYQLQAYPESNRKRTAFDLRPVAPTVGNAYVEAFIDGAQNFQFRLARNSTCLLKFLGVYYGNGGQWAAYEYTIGAHNTVDNVTIMSYNVNYQARSSAEIEFPAYRDLVDILFLFVAGANSAQVGRWNIRCVNLSEAVQP